jgi:hypothetical protein
MRYRGFEEFDALNGISALEKRKCELLHGTVVFSDAIFFPII